ncbi:glycoside hydrolase family 81 protein [Aaosphaeria arxii CBS 175.79]|uniref:glucan endo-1,3-beta-D-glucosidase n=1 Tax=Aaosphaeria arxii CBS 175.79 TaxID=1450172 RepID=A0A6A5Y6W8_9PLEO|nr:glycoside hydrolase family 81 protein [Aaosphaeria arxii CBS 175.79]KAF2021039.1 glycoside hydrolase family 81 protein [Aaosphaeria arxii CBS 175.79]
MLLHHLGVPIWFYIFLSLHWTTAIPLSNTLNNTTHLELWQPTHPTAETIFMYLNSSLSTTTWRDATPSTVQHQLGILSNFSSPLNTSSSARALSYASQVDISSSVVSTTVYSNDESPLSLPLTPTGTILPAQSVTGVPLLTTGYMPDDISLSFTATPTETSNISFILSQFEQSTSSHSITNPPTPGPEPTYMGQSSSSKSPPPDSDDDPTWTESLREDLKATLSPIRLSSVKPSASATAAPVPDANIFVPIQRDDILSQIPIGRHHPVPRKGIEDDYDRTLHTNKFYANAFLGNQDQPIWTHPYFIWWGKGTSGGQSETWGMNIGQVEAEEVVLGEGDPARFYINPRKQALILSAKELGPDTTLTTDTHLPFSVNINLNSGGRSEPVLTFPTVQGMSFVTGGYRNATPIIQCGGRGFRSISLPIFVGKSTKYRIEDSDGRHWVAYVNPAQGSVYDGTAFYAQDEHNLVGPSGFKGTIQIAKNPLGAEGEALYDTATGSFVIEARVTGTVANTKAIYTLEYTKVGKSPLLMFALPHHIASLDSSLKSKVTKLQLRTTTKGVATAIWTEHLTLTESSLPTNMGFGPFATLSGNRPKLSQATLDFMNTTAMSDLQAAIADQTPNDSLYFAGKTLAKFAMILLVMKEVLNNNAYLAGLEKLKSEMARYVDNRQKYPLFYDDSWKGLVSSAGFTDPGADFGSTYYNDHHFHYGYFVYTAAVIAHLDARWLEERDNKAWVNSLVKDFAESDYNGRDYPFSRSFDWFHGHSWAKGLFESADGKDEESSSEDGFASYAIKMWGKVIGDENMEKRGNLMLAIQARTFNTYFYLLPSTSTSTTNTTTNTTTVPSTPSTHPSPSSYFNTTSNTSNSNANTNTPLSSTIHPARFTPNTVTGILFENKVDHATYFGLDPHLIHGIHMLPLSPASVYLRPRPFVRHEWDAFFDRDRARRHVPGGWRGVLMANLALVDARASWSFFAEGVDGAWEAGWIDGGASRVWYLAFAAGLGGAR